MFLKKYFTVILVLFCFGFSNYIKANTNEEEKEVIKDSLLVELRDKFYDVEARYSDTAKAMVDTFMTIWMQGAFDDKQKMLVEKTFSGFQNMRMRTWPDKGLYLNVLLETINTQNSDVNFIAIHDSFEGLLNIRNQRHFIELLEHLQKITKNNTLFESRAVKWQFNSDDYYFKHDSVLMVYFDDEGELSCFSRNDTMRIIKTTGRYLLADNKWIGNNGRYTWERMKLDKEKIYAEFDSYTINLSRAQFEIDSVRYYNFYYFTEPLKGNLKERMVADISIQDARYPLFTSYRAIHEIEDLFNNIEYIGGFTMSGQRVLGTAADNRNAVINIYRNDSLFVTARSNLFSMRENAITSERAAVSFYLAGDSIYHPGIIMRYDNNDTIFSMTRDKKGMAQAPFHNTYHGIDMYSDAIFWNLNEPSIEIKSGGRQFSDDNEAVFESNNFFDDLRYRRMQGIEDVHPLVRLSRYSRERDSREFAISDFARHIRVDPASVKRQLIEFSHFGFVSLDLDAEVVTVNDRLFHYTMSYAGSTDFDVIRIESNANLNGEISLHNLDLRIYGVERIPLSDSKNVVIYPFGQQVTMHKNRDMNFHGKVESGLFEFYGREFVFDYDDFKIELNDTDSLSFSVRSHEPDSRGRYSLVRVRTVLEGLNGEILIDHPNNKSGNMPYPRYPIFNSESESTVYYDRDFIHNGAYTREDVSFQITPFSIDSLDHATTENIAFDGVVMSTGIFPDFEDYLTVQEDYSLGFSTKTPDEGYPIYGGKANYFGEVRMSYEGLKTPGRLEYLNATVELKEMIMFPDSARGKVNIFNLEGKTGKGEHAQVYARETDIQFLPFEDYLAIQHTNKPIEIFDGLAKLEGGLELSSEKLRGEGYLDLFSSRIFSDDYTFLNSELEALDSKIDFFMADGETINLQMTDYETYVDINNKKGNFNASNINSFIKFPVNKYISSIDKIEWDHENNQMALTNKKGRDNFNLDGLSRDELIDINFSGFDFVSTHNDKDSLSFYVDNALFNKANNRIEARGVNIIKVADAAIFPYNEEAVILPDSELDKFYDAIVIADTNKRQHEMYQADLTISSRNYFNGSACYDYVNDGGYIQGILFEELAVNREGKTYGVAEIREQDEFFVARNFPFKGKVNLLSTEENFNYHGNSKILAGDCGDLLNSTWFRFEATVNPDSVMIPIIEDLRDKDNNRISTSVKLAGDSLHIYPAMFSRRKHYLDQEIISANGYLTFNRLTNQYVITSKERFLDGDVTDNRIRLNPTTCVIRADGDVMFHYPDQMGQVKIESFGNVVYDIKEDDLELDIVMALDFFFNNRSLNIVKESIEEAELDDINLNRQKYIRAMYNIFGKEKGSELLAELDEEGALSNFPEELNNTFFFADINFRWHQEHGSFISSGPIGIGSVKNTMFNKYVEGFMEYRKRRGADVLTFYFEPDKTLGGGMGDVWFYYRYTRGNMETVSIISDYNEIIRDVRPRRRRMDVERGEASYSYMLSGEFRPLEFFRNMKSIED